MSATRDPIVVIGGGFYGCSIAEFLAARGARVHLFEREHALLSRSSYHSQARLHGGYHYPRSFGTAYRSRLNFSRFVAEYRPAVATDAIALYAIARVDSKVNARQFETFCRNIEAPLRPARKPLRQLFNEHLIEAVYEVEEFIFDAAVLRTMMGQRLRSAGVQVTLGRAVAAVREEAGSIVIDIAGGGSVAASWVFNCAYAAVNAVPGIRRTLHDIKHEIAELALVETPAELRGISITVMDGPFFSLMPFPERKLSTLSHVRYTPHAGWVERGGGVDDPYSALAGHPRRTRFPHMVRDALRYVPAMRGLAYRESLFEVKAVLAENEADDGRPILFEPSGNAGSIVTILGSKIDNVYDALAAVEIRMHEEATLH